MSVQEVFNSFDEFDEEWHKAYRRRTIAANKDIKDDDMYCNAQYDDIPYWLWEENEPYVGELRDWFEK